MFLNGEVEPTDLVETRVEEIVGRLFRLFETDESQRCRDGYGREMDGLVEMDSDESESRK